MVNFISITEFDLFQLVKYNLEKKIREQVSQIRSATDRRLITKEKLRKLTLNIVDAL